MSIRPRLLDLFCCAGGCSVGYQQAGFDVVGVDLDRAALKNYPFPAVRADAMAVLRGGIIDLDAFDVIHASPPCQAYSITKNAHQSAKHPDLLPETLDLLRAWGGLWVVENVPGAPMPGALTLCGSEFGLKATDTDGKLVALKRHRLFLSSITLMGAGGCSCNVDRAAGRIAGVYGNGCNSHERARWRAGGYTPPSTQVRRDLLGVDWHMSRNQLSQAIPPAYTRFIGEQLLAHLAVAA